MKYCNGGEKITILQQIQNTCNLRIPSMATKSKRFLSCQIKNSSIFYNQYRQHATFVCQVTDLSRLQHNMNALCWTFDYPLKQRKRNFGFLASFNVVLLQHSNQSNFNFHQSKPHSNTISRASTKWYPCQGVAGRLSVW